jgi:hypothetical protein
VDFDACAATWIEAPWIVLITCASSSRHRWTRRQEKERELKIRSQRTSDAFASPADVHFFFHELRDWPRAYTVSTT